MGKILGLVDIATLTLEKAHHGEAVGGQNVPGSLVGEHGHGQDSGGGGREVA